jgi:hypothetical protein
VPEHRAPCRESDTNSQPIAAHGRS